MAEKSKKPIYNPAEMCCDCCRMDKKIEEICKKCCKGKDGITPHIGGNGNWWIGDTDTGVHSQGEQGPKGDKGDKGDPGSGGDFKVIGIEALCTAKKGVNISKIPFNDVMRDNTEGIVEIQPDGEIIFHANGLYHIDWQVTFNDQTTREEVQCTLVVNNGPYETASTVGYFGQICGSAWLITSIYGINPPIHAMLAFTSGSVKLAETEVQANITIIKLG